MSAGSNVVQNDLSACAPKFHEAVSAALDECREAGYDAIVFEALRSQDLQNLYWKRGRDSDGNIVNQNAVVTNVRYARRGWHFFGLAVDVISESKEWSVSDEWRAAVTIIFKKHGLHWGGDWPHFHDLPHYQWTNQRDPSDNDRSTYEQGGFDAVWTLNNAQ